MSGRLMKFTVMMIVALMALAAPLAAGHSALAQDDGTCGQAPATRLMAGQMARVAVGSGIGNNLRAFASTDAAVMGVMPQGEIVTVVAGPQCAAGYQWFQVTRWDGQTGWAAEGSNDGYWMEPWPAVNAPLATGPAPEATVGQIAFLTGTTADALDLGVMAADGSATAKLSQSAGSESVFAWSPDGTQIAFAYATSLTTSDLALVAPNGQDFRQVTNTGTWIEDLAWSPDGTRIAFTMDPMGSGMRDIFSIKTDGSELRNLTNTPTVSESGAAWSPDGTRILYTALQNDQTDVVVASAADGANAVLLSDSPNNEMDAVWSPDSTRIAYVSMATDPGATGDIVLANADGTNPVLVANNPARHEFSPVFNTAGTHLAYFDMPTVDGQAASLMTVRIEGLQRIDYGVQAAPDSAPAWSPDGGWLTFVSASTPGATPTADIYLIRVNGSNLVNLTNSAALDVQPAWAPRITAVSTPQAPAAPGAEDLLLIYDRAVPVFTLQNVSGGTLDLRPLRFVGVDKTVPATIWESEFLGSPLDTFRDFGCLMAWGFPLPEQPAPAECGTARQGWVTDNEYVFWLGDTFEVYYGDVLLTTCDVAAGRCIVDLP